MTRTALRTSILCGLALAVAGCGIPNPDAAPTPDQPAARAHSSTGATPDRRGGGERALLARFARAWINYTFATLPSQERALTALATGGLARQLHADSEQNLQAQYTRASDARSRGTVELIGLRGDEPAIVVTKSTLTIDGQTQSDWSVYLAAVTNTPRDLRVASWTPAMSN